MSYYGGPEVSSCVSLRGPADIEYDVYGDVVEMYFGGKGGGFILTASEENLTELITTSSAALAKMQEDE